MASVAERLTDCFAAVFPELSRDEIGEASSDTLAAWDSLAGVTILSLIEEEFRIQIPAEDLLHLTSFSLALDYVATRIGE